MSCFSRWTQVCYEHTKFEALWYAPCKEKKARYHAGNEMIWEKTEEFLTVALAVLFIYNAWISVLLVSSTLEIQQLASKIEFHVFKKSRLPNLYKTGCFQMVCKLTIL